MDTIAAVDAAGTGCLDFPEFLNLMTRAMRDRPPEDEWRRAFRFFDKDGDGELSVADLRARAREMGRELTETEARDMIREADPQQRGALTLDDFRNVMTRN